MPHRQGETPIRSVRVPDDLWIAAQRVAADRGDSLTAVIVRALRRYVASHPLDSDDGDQ